MAKLYGDKTPNKEVWAEILISDPDTQTLLAVIHPPVLDQISIQENMSYIPHLQADLVSSMPINELSRGLEIKVNYHMEGIGSTLMLDGFIDFIKAIFSPDTNRGQSQIRIQARSKLSKILDYGLNKKDTGSYKNIFETLIGNEDFINEIKAPEEEVQYYINTKSKFSTLLLFALATECNIEISRDNKITIMENKDFMRLLATKKAVVVENIISGELRDGQPINIRKEH